MRTSRDGLLIVLGIYYILLGVLAFLNSYWSQSTDQVYWFCYFSLFLIGIGFVRRDSLLIASQLNILMAAMVIWSIDFSYVFFTHTSLWGYTDYFFQSKNVLAQFVSLQHLYTIPLALYALSVLKLRGRYIWLISILQAFVIFIITRMFTSSESNINCSFHACGTLFNFSWYYPALWLIGVSIMILITDFLLRRLPFLRY